MKNYFLITIIICLLFSCNNNTPLVINVEEFGAIGDSLKVNTKAIQKAIDICSKKGGGIVEIKNGIFISGTILLKNNVTLKIDKNAQLIGSSNPKDYKSIDAFVDATGQKRGHCFIGSKNATNIGIIGKGTIDGNGSAFLSKTLRAKTKALGINDQEMKELDFNRPFLLRFVTSSNIIVKDVTLTQASAWTCHFYQSHSITVDNVAIYSHADKNNDGIDMDSSHDITIKNCNIDSGDDAICFKTTSPLPTYNIKVSNCTLKSDWGAIKFGTESMGDFYNIQVSDCKIHNTRGGGIKILSVDGANIKDITINNIEMDKVDMPIFIRLGERLRTYRNAEKQEVGSIKSVKISNITASTQDYNNSRVQPPTGVFITGTPNHKIEDVSLKNIKITLPGGGKSADVVKVEESVNKYPEFNFFKVLPASGLYARHVQSLETEKIHFNILSKDERELIVLEDVENTKEY